MYVCDMCTHSYLLVLFAGEPEPLDQQKQQVTASEGTELFNYKGNDVESFISTSSPSGLYQLEILSTEKDSNFKVYATTTPESDQPYPELPYDPRVDVTALGRTTVTLAWKPTPTGVLMGQPVQYCVVINKEHNFKSLCAAEARMSVDDTFMAAPKPGRDFSPFDFAHFGFVPSDNDFARIARWPPTGRSAASSRGRTDPNPRRRISKSSASVTRTSSPCPT